MTKDMLLEMGRQHEDQIAADREAGRQVSIMNKYR